MKGSLFFLALTLITANIELDIFLPSLPLMQTYFGVEEKAMSWVVGINFLGFCLSGLFMGHLSDLYGRKKLLGCSSFIFFLSSVGCLFAGSFSHFLSFRFFQGLSCGGPATITFAAICDQYKGNSAARIIAFFNGLVTASLVAAPLLGVVLTNLFGWRANFACIAILSFFSLIFLCMFKDQHKPQKEEFFSIKLKRICADLYFWKHGLIAIFMYAAIVIFMIHFPIIAMNHLDISRTDYGISQAGVMLTFVGGSFLSSFLLKKNENRHLSPLGFGLTWLGSLGLIVFALFYPTKLWLLLSSIGIFNCGAALLISIHSTKVIDQSKAKGLISSLLGSLRMLVATSLLSITYLFYNQTFLPIALSIFVAFFFSLILFTFKSQGSLIE